MSLRKKSPLLLLSTIFITLFIAFKSFSFAQTEEPKWERMGLEGWQMVGFGHNHVAIDPYNPQIIYAIARKANIDPDYQYPYIYDILKTTNGGISWESKKNGLPTNNSVVLTVAIDPINPETLYIAVQEGWGPFRDGGIYKTTNGGDTWTRVLRGLGYIAIVIDYENPDIVLALNNGVNNLYGFYKSTDGGLTWERKGAGIITYPTYYRRIILDPTNHLIVYVITGRYNGSSGIFKSTDGGENFISIPDNVGLNGQVYDLVIDLNNNNILYANVRTSTDDAGVYKSIDQGNSWLKTSYGLDNAGAETIELDPRNTNVLYISAYKARTGQGVLINSPYYSTDSGQTWFPFNNGLPEEGNNLYIGYLYAQKNYDYLVASSYDGLWKHPLISSSASPTPTPTPTPIPCVLQNFGDSNGNPLRQTDNSWAEDHYGGVYFDLEKNKIAVYNDENTNLKFLPFILKGNNQDNIASWGCALTSYTMMLNYTARKQGAFFYTYTPDVVNEWLQRNLGYSAGSIVYANGQPVSVTDAGVDPNKIQEFAKEKNIYAAYDGRFGESRNILNHYLCRGDPVKLKVNNSGYEHHIAASGQTYFNNLLTYRIHDPLENSPISLLQKYSDRFQYMDAFDTFVNLFYPPWIMWYLHSPAELIITDPDGNKTGEDPKTGIKYSEIEESSYYEESLSSADGDADFSYKVLSIKNPKEGLYTVEVIGKEDGSYALETRISDEESNIEVLHLQDMMKKDIDHIYNLEYSKTDDSPQIVRQVSINIRPFGRFNIVNPNSNGVVPAAILTTETFDAENVDPASVTFGPDRAPALGKPYFLRDFDKDGDNDLILYFRAGQTGISENDEQACMSGKTKNGIEIEGCDFVKTVGSIFDGTK